jgi:hypothetical protein
MEAYGNWREEKETGEEYGESYFFFLTPQKTDENATRVPIRTHRCHR